MKIDLKKLFDAGEEKVVIQDTLDLSEMTQWGVKPFVQPVRIEGLAQNKAGVVTLSYTVSLNYRIPCDRCLIPIEHKDQTYRFEHIIVRSLNQESNDDFVVLPDGILDLDELATSDIILELPIKNICSEGCKGLCPQCGANLNEKSCDCKAPSDPRWSVLDQLLEQ